MTVSLVLFYALFWAFLLSVFFALFWLAKLIERTNEVDKLERICELNLQYHTRIVNFCYNKICDGADLRYKDLPKASTAIYQHVQNVFLDNPELTAYELPVDKVDLTAHQISRYDLTPRYKWNLDQEEMPSAVLAHLWLNGVI